LNEIGSIPNSGGPDLDKIVLVDVIQEKKVHNRQETQEFEEKKTSSQTDTAAHYHKHQASAQLKVTDCAHYSKIICVDMMIYQFQRFTDMVTISNYNFRMILLNRYYHLGIWRKRVNLVTVYDKFNFQKPK
jgi:hypothetical protein